jgi:Arc/MetJ family transcription regulator
MCITALLLLLQAFEETQGKLDEELASRTARELALLEEEAARRAAEEEAARWAVLKI